MINTLSEIIEDLKSQEAAIQTQIDAKNEQIAQLQLDISQLQADIPPLQLELDGLIDMRVNGQKLLGLNAEFSNTHGKIIHSSPTEV